MIFKCSGNSNGKGGSEAVKRIIAFHLKHRPNQGQQEQKRSGEQADLRPFLDAKKAKKNAGQGVGYQSSGKNYNIYGGTNHFY